MDCYGKYYNNIPECKTCQYQDYCKEAIYHSKASTVNFDQLIFTDKYTTETIQKEEITYISNFSKVLSEFFHLLQQKEGEQYSIFDLFTGLAKIYKSNPKTYRIVLIKLISPHLSYQQIANQIGCDKQLIHFHLKKAIGIFPELDYSIIIDRRKYPKEQAAKRMRIVSNRKYQLSRFDEN